MCFVTVWRFKRIVTYGFKPYIQTQFIDTWHLLQLAHFGFVKPFTDSGLFVQFVFFLELVSFQKYYLSVIDLFHKRLTTALEDVSES